MKLSFLLKTVLDICFYALIISSAAGLIGIVYNFLNPENPVSVKINEEIVTSLSSEIIAIILMGSFFILLFIGVIYYLRKLVNNFNNNEIFSKQQEFYLKRIGMIILFYIISDVIISFILDIVYEGRFDIGVGISSEFGSAWFVLAIGLFFLYLSQVFENARKLKEENDYTV